MLILGQKGTWGGVISRVIYTGQNNFAILAITTNKGEKITAKGTFECPHEGANVKITGEVIGGDYGLQINAEETTTDMSAENLAAVNFLSDVIAGVGDSTAFRIVGTYGANVESYMTDEKKLTAIKGISNSKVAKTIESFKENKPLFAIYLATGGRVTKNQADKIFKTYEESAAKRIKENPYRLMYDLDGFGFRTCDEIAKGVGVAYDSPERLSASITHILQQASVDGGHMWLYFTDIVDNAAKLLCSQRELKRIYYNKVLGVQLSNDYSEWDDLELSEYAKMSNEKKFNTLLGNFQKKSKKSTLIKKTGLTLEEVDCLNFYLEEIEEMRSKLKAPLEEAMIKIPMNNNNATIGDFLPDEITGTGLTVAMNDGHEIRFVGLAEPNGACRIYNVRAYLTEVIAAAMLVKMLDKPALINIPKDDIDSAIKKTEEEQGKSIPRYAFDADQKMAVHTSVSNRVSVITGGPGRGKTEILKIILNVWASHGGDVLLLAPTGRAAKRMNESTGYNASTIHRNIAKNKNGRIRDLDDNGGPLLVVVDEVSMVDATLLRMLLDTIGPDVQLCLVGDIDQLPSVSAGNVLSDLISSGIIPVTKLVHCHRNSGSISYNTTVVNDGLGINALMIDTHFRTRWVTGNTPTERQKNVQQAIIAVYKKQLENYSIKDIVILTPKSKVGLNSVETLNRELKKIVLPDAKECDAYKGFNVDDRVMQTKNDYSQVCEKCHIDEDGFKHIEHYNGVFNGDIGTVIEVDTLYKTVKVEFDDGKTTCYNSSSIAGLMHAYAMTYHKSQGSEFKVVILSMTNGDFKLLNRKILYTGISRAKEKEFLVGEAKAVGMAINNTYDVERNTSFAWFLRKFDEITTSLKKTA